MNGTPQGSESDRSGPESDWAVGADWPPRPTRHQWAEVAAAPGPGTSSRRWLLIGLVAALLAIGGGVVWLTRPAAGPGVAAPAVLTAPPSVDPQLTVTESSSAAANRIAQLLSTGRIEEAAGSVCTADREKFRTTFQVPDGWELGVTSRGTFEDGEYATARFWLTGTELSTGEATTTSLTQTMARNDAGVWLWCSGTLGPEDSEG